ncbi:MAG TPA: phage baseplate assembly protein V [Candidatus Limnocylindrales bacterium]|nr:phage baseplate assembly protein V [Candidatus Limnocylindrales bacterium]
MRMPVIKVSVGGRPVPGRVLSLRVATRLSQPAQAEIAIEAYDNAWPLDQSLTIELDDEPLFGGEVTAVELVSGPGSERVCLLRGYDRLHRLRKRQKPRVFENVTVEDLARTLTADLDLTVESERSGGRIERLVQHRQSDWELLTQAAGRAGLYIVLSGRTLRLSGLKPKGEPIKLVLGANLWRASAETNRERAVDEVTAIGWHPRKGEFVTEKAGSGQQSRTLVDQPMALLSEAPRAAVEAGAARATKIEGVVEGDVRLLPGRAVALSGLDDAVDGVYGLSEAIHEINVDGYQVKISSEPPETEAPPAAASITLGKVTDVSDPDSAGRVEVSLPAYGDVSVGWLAVLCPGAGPGRGVVAMPDPGDLVVVALPHGDPAEGLVLGSVFGTHNAPEKGRHWILHSGAGQVIVLDDDRKAIKLSNADGSCLDLAPDAVTLTAHTDMVIEAPGHHLNIRAANIDFDRALLPVPGGVTP